MKTQKKLGIWMDHSNANLIDVANNKMNKTIASTFTFEMKEETLDKSESSMHNKEQQLNKEYFQKIGDEILNYDQVLLFGPTNAKAELHNFLNKDLHFKDIKIDIESADKMSDSEKSAFVKKHFNKN